MSEIHLAQSAPSLQLEAKARQAAKLAEIREALVAAGCNSAAKQATVLGVSRATAWALLNRDKRTGPSAVVLKRMLSLRKLPRAVRRKVEEYCKERSAALWTDSGRRGRNGFAISFVTPTTSVSRNRKPSLRWAVIIQQTEARGE